MSEFILREGSMQQRALHSRSPVRVIGGGFGNGKTTTVVQLALKLAKMYPGSNGLIARETLPKLNDTVRKEFLKWCPKTWIKSFPMSQNASNTCTLVNNSMINFRYISQQGQTKGEDSTTSNLLSATYDWVIIDQIEDPGITQKDWNDLFGRLRGSTPGDFDPNGYDDVIGDYSTLPRSGPRWLIVTCNPTRNWFYREVIEPLQVYLRTGRVTDKLLCKRDPQHREKPWYDENGNIKLMIELFEGSTYENMHVYEMTGATDFLEKLESVYRGVMRERFLLGKWAAYEGLIYADYSDLTHGVTQAQAHDYLDKLSSQGIIPTFVEGYDFGTSTPSCYLLGFGDPYGNVIVCDGYYEPGLRVDEQAARIRDIREKWLPHGADVISYADPDIFRKKHTSKATVGQSVSNMFFDEGIVWRRGNNDILNGIIKIQSYLAPRKGHRHPITGDFPSAYLYIAVELTWMDNEFSSYMWKKDRAGNTIDEPLGGTDHAMDALKYFMSDRVPLAMQMRPPENNIPDYLHKWGELEPTPNRSRRHG